MLLDHWHDLHVFSPHDPLGQEYLVNDAGDVSPAYEAMTHGAFANHETFFTNERPPAPTLVGTRGGLQIDLIWDPSVANAAPRFHAGHHRCRRILHQALFERRGDQHPGRLRRNRRLADGGKCAGRERKLWLSDQLQHRHRCAGKGRLQFFGHKRTDRQPVLRHQCGRKDARYDQPHLERRRRIHRFQHLEGHRVFLE